MSDDVIKLFSENGPSDDYLPKGTSPGRVLFHLWPIPRGLGSHRWQWCEIDVLDYDSDTAVFWMIEGAGIEYWLELQLDIELEGTYVIEGVTCSWWKDYWGESDEEWDIPIVRRATEQEIETESLS